MSSADYASIERLTDDQRYQVADRMTEHGLNKCFDCCLVPNCPACGPCAEHDEQAEARLAFNWAVKAGLDHERNDSSRTEDSS